VRAWLAWWHKTLSIDNPYNIDLLHEARFIAADVLHSHGYEDPVVPFTNAILLKSTLEGRAPVIDVHSKTIRIPGYMSFFHHGGHTSSWRFHTYFTLMLDFYSAAANRTNGKGGPGILTSGGGASEYAFEGLNASHVFV